MSESKMLDVSFYLDAAKQHGEDSEPDHEVGDLQAFLTVAWSLMSPSQRREFALHVDVHIALEGACADFEAEVDKL